LPTTARAPAKPPLIHSTARRPPASSAGHPPAACAQTAVAASISAAAGLPPTDAIRVRRVFACPSTVAIALSCPTKPSLVKSSARLSSFAIVSPPWLRARRRWRRPSRPSWRKQRRRVLLDGDERRIDRAWRHDRAWWRGRLSPLQAPIHRRDQVRDRGHPVGERGRLVVAVPDQQPVGGGGGGRCRRERRGGDGE
jgi:hypothetical protein